MNILLDAFYDRNYGDDIFLETVTGLFPGYKFYSFLEHYPQTVIDWAGKIPNLYLLPECDVFLQKNMFDAYMCIGGDVFPDNGDFTKRKKYVQAVKQVNGTVIFWGFSLFDSYSEQTQKDIGEMMAAADIIAPRDERSAQLLRQLVPEKEISPIADLAFLSGWTVAEKTARLGISVRRPNYATDEDMRRYATDLQEAINTYLAGDSTREVVLLSLSDGNTSDTPVVEEILQGVAEQERVKHRVYTGDIAAIKADIASCELVICTRLHAMISCIAMNVPFIPIVYEVKMEHILQDIGYRKNVIHFRDTGALAAQMTQALAEKEEPWWTPEGEQEYISRTDAMKDKVLSLLGGDRVSVVKEDLTGPVCPEKEQVIASLGGALQQRERDVATLENALAQRSTDVATLEKALGEQNQNIQQLCATIGENNDKIAQMEAKLQAIEATFPYKVYRAVKTVFSKN